MLTRRSLLSLTIVSLHIGFALLQTSCVPALPIIKDEKEILTIPADFQESTPSSGASPSPLPSHLPSAATLSWKDFFPNSELTSLIEEGLKNNQELHIIEQEIYIANNEVFARQGEYLPKVDFQSSYRFEKVGKYTSQGASDEANQVPEHLQIGRIGLATSWELDVWGKLRNASKAAYYGYLSSVEGRKVLVTHLVAEISNLYFELEALDNQLEIVNSYVKVLKQITEMVMIQKSAAKATSLGVRRFEAEVFKNESRQFQLQQQITMTENKINALLGRFPQKLARNSKEFLNLALTKIDAGVPTNLLDNRPDLKAAALELQAAKLSVSSTKARFYPSLNIEAGVGFESFNSSHFLDTPESLFYGLVGSLTAPLLNRQAIKAAYFSANNKQIQAVYRYEQTLVKAYVEVVNQLNMIKNLNQVYNLKSKQVEALKDAVTISNLLFQAARVDYIEALFTQRDALEAQLELIETKQSSLSAYVNLYKALGGGWKPVSKQENPNRAHQ
jgi:NodT family efflux transporter outer membrane factor (OMF) lipoprotein